jgi:hypothetical protein
VGSAAILLGLALYAATIIAVHRWIADLPARVALLIERERRRGEQRAFDTLRAAAGERVAALVSSLRDFEEQTRAAVRARAAAESARVRLAEGRAEAAMRREDGVVTALEAASALVAQLRAALDHAGPPAADTLGDPRDPAERKTVEVRLVDGVLPNLGGDDCPEEEEEQTKVAARPRAPGSGLRLVPARPAIPPSGPGAAS